MRDMTTMACAMGELRRQYHRVGRSSGSTVHDMIGISIGDGWKRRRLRFLPGWSLKTRSPADHDRPVIARGEHQQGGTT
jgi:hypothetical protein